MIRIIRIKNHLSSSLKNNHCFFKLSPEVFLHEDPTKALVVQMYKPGCWTGWHFDRAILTTIINLGEPAGGGFFECAPDIRTLNYSPTRSKTDLIKLADKR